MNCVYSKCQCCRRPMDGSVNLDQALRHAAQQGNAAARFLTGQANRLLESVARSECAAQLQNSDGDLERALSQALRAELTLFHTML